MLSELRPWFEGWPSADRFRKDMDDLLKRFLGEGGPRSLSSEMSTWPAVESFFKDGNWVMRFDLPGVEPEDIDVSIVGNILTIKASRERGNNNDNQNSEVSFGRLERTLTLPKGVESGQVKASYRHGVLELTMPASPELVGRKIPIETATEEKKQLEHQAA
jgi:HSP20 family protein